MQLQEQNLQKYNEMKNTWEEKLKSNFPDQNKMREYVDSVQAFGNPSKHFSQDVVEYMYKHENGPKILMHFADNPENVQKFNNMHMWDKMSYLQNIPQATAQSAAPAVSRAAAPVGSLKNKSTMSKSIDEMSDDELLEQYRKNPNFLH